MKKTVLVSIIAAALSTSALASEQVISNQIKGSYKLPFLNNTSVEDATTDRTVSLELTYQVGNSAYLIGTFSNSLVEFDTNAYTIGSSSTSFGAGAGAEIRIQGMPEGAAVFGEAIYQFLSSTVTTEYPALSINQEELASGSRAILSIGSRASRDGVYGELKIGLAHISLEGESDTNILTRYSLMLDVTPQVSAGGHFSQNLSSDTYQTSVNVAYKF